MLYEVDDAATQRLLDSITAQSVRALDQCGDRSAEIDQQARAALVREAEERKAIEERIEQGRRTEPKPHESAPSAGAWRSRPARPTLFDLGGEELTANPPPESGPPPRSAKPRGEEDDDLSGRSWLR